MAGWSEVQGGGENKGLSLWALNFGLSALGSRLPVSALGLGSRLCLEALGSHWVRKKAELKPPPLKGLLKNELQTRIARAMP